ncbi:lysozyme inhibitor LprI family protein [Massilia rubra]|nr:lysozyme inhibitor LprI family protein [Massilia rubra]
MRIPGSSFIKEKNHAHSSEHYSGGAVICPQNWFDAGTGARCKGSVMSDVSDFLIVALLAGVIATLEAKAQTTTPVTGAAENCDQFSQSDRRDCVDKMATDSALVLKEAEAKAVAAIAGWDEDDKYTRLAKSRLAASRIAFARFRQAQCAFATSMRGAAAGDSHEISRLACVANMNAARVIDLARETAGLPPK